MQETNEALVRRIQVGEADMLPRLWEQVQGYVKYQANRWFRVWWPTRPTLEFDDLYQCGYIALSGAVETFDTAGDMAFVGWLSYYLRGGVLHSDRVQDKNTAARPYPWGREPGRTRWRGDRGYYHRGHDRRSG